MLVLPKGVRHMPGYLDRAAQEALVEEVRNVVQRRRCYVPAMPRTGKEMSVRMTNCGSLGWVTDKELGYRYQPTHPVTGEPWPPIPDALLRLWQDVSGLSASAGGLPGQFLHRQAPRWACTRTATRPIFRARGVGLARRRLPVPRRRTDARRPHQIFQAEKRRCRRARRRRPAVLPRRRPHLSVDLGAAEEWRPHQPDAAAGDEGSLASLRTGTFNVSSSAICLQ